MTHLTDKQKHDAIRAKIAKAATKQLFDFLKKHGKESITAFRMNQIMIGKNPKVKPNKLRKAKLVENDKLGKAKETYSMVAHYSCTQRSRTGHSEWFEDEGMSVRSSEGIHLLITEHALNRAFERAWWFFKGKSCEEWIEAFKSSFWLAQTELLRQDADEVQKNNDVFIGEYDVLNAVYQLGSKDTIVLLTYTPPSNLEGERR